MKIRSTQTIKNIFKYQHSYLYQEKKQLLFCSLNTPSSSYLFSSLDLQSQTCSPVQDFSAAVAAAAG